MTVVQQRQFDVHEYALEPELEGPFAGQTGISLYMGPALDNKFTLNSFDRLANRWNWMNKLDSYKWHTVFRPQPNPTGRPNDPCYKRHADAIEGYLFMMTTGFTRIVTPGVQIPPENYRDDIDHFTLQVNSERLQDAVDHGNKTIEWYADNFLYDDGLDIIVRVDHARKAVQAINAARDEFQFSHGKFWLSPDGDSLEEIRDNWDEVLDAMKTGGWRTSPRFDILELEDEDDE